MTTYEAAASHRKLTVTSDSDVLLLAVAAIRRNRRRKRFMGDVLIRALEKIAAEWKERGL